MEAKIMQLKSRGYSDEDAIKEAMKGPKSDGLVDMKSPKKSKKELKNQYEVSPSSQDRYPYGLEIRLENESIDKLGMTELPEVGEVVMITAKATVESVSSSERQDKSPHRCVTLQITRLKVS